MLIEEQTGRVKGRVIIEHFGPDGILKQHLENLILTDGIEIFADLLVGAGGTQIKAGQTAVAAMAAGNSAAVPTVADTDLVGAEFGAGVNRYAATVNSQPSSGLARFVANFTAGICTGTWKELVLADTYAAKGARKCVSRITFGDIAKGALDTITVTWEITFV